MVSIPLRQGGVFRQSKWRSGIFSGTRFNPFETGRGLSTIAYG